jgi:hypothetical protein
MSGLRAASRRTSRAGEQADGAVGGEADAVALASALQHHRRFPGSAVRCRAGGGPSPEPPIQRPMFHGAVRAAADVAESGWALPSRGVASVAGRRMKPAGPPVFGDAEGAYCSALDPRFEP